MSLNKEQFEFSKYFAILITYIYAQGYTCSIGDVYARDGHCVKSKHYDKLAGDINLFKDGKLLTLTIDHEPFGFFWETLHKKCTWGGRFNDGNHYSWDEVKR